MKERVQIIRYWPLIALLLVAALGAWALTYRFYAGIFEWMHFFMGLFLSEFALLKLFHLSGFADGFQKYDLLAKKSRAYAYVYPFIELGLGLAYLSSISPLATYVITLVVAAVSAAGVIRALKAGLDLRCACMGTVLDVPLSTVTLAEDIGMGVMALLMILY